MLGRRGSEGGSTALLGSPAHKARKVQPRILLEALSPLYAKLVLGFTYCALLLGVALAVLSAQTFLHRSVEFVARPCASAAALPALAQGQTSCVLPVPGARNASLWQSAVNGLDLLDGSFELDLLLQEPRPDLGNTVLVLAFQYRFFGGSLAAAADSAAGRIQWSQLAAGTNQTVHIPCPCMPSTPSNVSAVRETWQDDENAAQWQAAADALLQAAEPPTPGCPPGNEPACGVTSLLSRGQLSAAAAGGYTAYNLSLTFTGVNVTSLSKATTARLTYFTATERVTDLVVRASMMLLTLAFSTYWWWRVAVWELRRIPGQAARSALWRCCCSFRLWVPFRRWVGYLLIAVVVWQNPLFIALELLPRQWVPPGWYLAANIVSAVSWAALFLLWLLFMDGLRYIKLAGSLPCAFYAWKAAFAVLLTAVAGAQVMLLAPGQWACLPGGQGVCDPPRPVILDADTLESIRAALLGTGALYGVLLGSWFVWFLLVTLRTSRVLRRLPYGPSRMQQLTFRFFMWQQWIVVVFVLGLNVVPLVSFLHRTVQSARLAHHVDSSPDASLATTPAQLLASAIAAVSSGQSPPAEYLVVTAYALAVAAVYLPPPAGAGSGMDGDGEAPGASGSVLQGVGDGGGASALLNGMAWFTASIGSVLGSSSTVQDEHRFSLTTACWLFDFAWAVYFDPPEATAILAAGGASVTPAPETGAVTDSGAGSLLTPPHGFTLHRFVYNAGSDTAAMVLVRGPRVVVAFRGTASKKNVQTDLAFMRSEVVFGEGSTGDALVSDSAQAAPPPPDAPSDTCSLTCLSRCCARNCRCCACVPGVRQALPLVHQGFWRAYSSVRTQLRGEVLSALAEAGPHASLYFTGHSLGGALAQMAAYDMREFVRTHRRAWAHMARGARSTQALRPPGTYEDPLTGEVRQLPSGRSTASAGGGGAAEGGGSSRRRARQTRLPHLSGEGDGLTPYSGGLCDCGECCGLPCSCCECRCCGDLLDAGDIDDEALVQFEGDFLDITGPQADPAVGILPSAPERSVGDSGVTVYTFGSPRVGNATFARLYDASNDGTFRVEADGDVITDIPKFIMLYKHVGVPVLVDVFGNAIVSPSFIEKRLQAASKTSFVAHSMNTYRRALINARDMIGLPLAPRLVHDASAWKGGDQPAA